MHTKLLLIFLLIGLTTFSQESSDGKYTVGLLPTTSTAYGADAYERQMQEVISKVFVGKSRFTVVDRTKFEDMAKERNLQKQEDFINGNVVEQGKNLGAQYLISGSINQLSKSGGYVERTKLLTNEKYRVYITKVDINLNVQLIDVATGVVKSNTSVTKSVSTETTSEQVAVANAINALEGNIKAWANDVFPVNMKIVKIETVNKKGLPETVLITGGEDMDLQRSGFVFNTSSELEVYENEVLTVDGKQYKRPITIGKLKLAETQGELSICKVKSGGEEIQKRMNEGKVLLLKIKSY